MKGYIHYVKGIELSEQMAKDSLESYKKYDWDVELIEGFTSDTLDRSDVYNYKVIERGRIRYLGSNKRTLTKLSIIANQIRFWKMVVEANESMAYIEHDSICIRHYFHVPFEDVLLTNLDVTSIPHQMKHILGREETLNYKLPVKPNPCANLEDIPDWPILYKYGNDYMYSKMPPGVSSYVISPQGAKRLLDAIEEYGIEQGDMTINTHNVDIKYSIPKMSTYNKYSHKLKSTNEDYHDK